MVSLGLALLCVVFAVGVAFLVAAVRLVRREDLTISNIAAAVGVMTATTAFSDVQAYGEPVYVGGRLVIGAALFLVITGIVLGLGGFVVSGTRRWLGILLLVAAAGILFGDVAGWLQRSMGPSYIPEGREYVRSR